jgi:hypothetical protein
VSGSGVLNADHYDCCSTHAGIDGDASRSGDAELHVGPAGHGKRMPTAQVGTIFTSRSFVEKAKLTATLDQFDVAKVRYLEDLRPHFKLLDKLWLIFYALRFPSSAIRHAAPDETAVILFTSGSEGKPKGVALSHRSILSNCYQMHAIIDIGCNDKFLTALPLFHSFGLGGHDPTADNRLPNFLLSIAAALSRDPGVDLRPGLHGAFRNQHVPGKLREIRASLRFLQAALRGERRRKAERRSAPRLRGALRDPNSGGVRGDGMLARHFGKYAGGE